MLRQEIQEQIDSIAGSFLRTNELGKALALNTKNLAAAVEAEIIESEKFLSCLEMSDWKDKEILILSAKTEFELAILGAMIVSNLLGGNVDIGVWGAKEQKTGISLSHGHTRPPYCRL